MNWYRERLGEDCSALGSYRRAEAWVAYLDFRGVILAASSHKSEADAEQRLEEKVGKHLEAILGLEEISAAQELNLVLETGTEAEGIRRFIRPMNRDRARLELDLGVDGSLVFQDAESGRTSIASRGESGEPEFLHVGDPVHGDDSLARPRPIPQRTPSSAEEQELRKEKSKRVRALLRCPQCRGELSDRDDALFCAGCAHSYPSHAGKPVLALSRDYDASPEGVPASQNPYGQQCLSLIEQYRDGWVLDCGSGSPSLGFYNVVHLDLAAYPEVDLVTDGEALPFADASFDCVLSEAVLEHVRDPWGYVRELARVLKPGGRVRLDVAFLQPYHGYPDHYFNMTRSGLELILEQAGFVAEYLDVGPHQHPFVVLSMILNGFVQGTADQNKREKILGMRISEAIERLASGHAEPFDGLDQNSIHRLASGFQCVARKSSEEA